MQDVPLTSAIGALAKLEICVALDQECGMAGVFRVTEIPTVVIVDRSNIIRDVHMGTSPELGAELRRALDEVLKAELPQGHGSSQMDEDGSVGSEKEKK
jgi:thioredoxin-like negative regulator of GroEL